MDTECIKKVIAVAMAALIMAATPSTVFAAGDNLYDYQKEFIETFRPLAKQYEESENINYMVTLAYSAHETGWGRGEDSRHNMFGMNNSSGRKANHGSRENSYRLFFQNLHKNEHLYGQVWNYPASDGYQQLLAIKSSYNTADAGYTQKITNVYNIIK